MRESKNELEKVREKIIRMIVRESFNFYRRVLNRSYVTIKLINTYKQYNFANLIQIH